MSDQQSPAPKKPSIPTVLTPILFGIAGVAWMVAALLQSKSGGSPAVYIAMGAFCICLSGVFGARAANASKSVRAKADESAET